MDVGEYSLANYFSVRRFLTRAMDFRKAGNERTRREGIAAGSTAVIPASISRAFPPRNAGVARRLPAFVFAQGQRTANPLRCQRLLKADWTNLANNLDHGSVFLYNIVKKRRSIAA
jgi:hypothetical protein